MLYRNPQPASQEAAGIRKKSLLTARNLENDQAHLRLSEKAENGGNTDRADLDHTHLHR